MSADEQEHTKENQDKSSDVWYIPQGVSFEIVTSILAYCYNSQKKNEVITTDSIKRIIPKAEKTIGNATKMLENIGILSVNSENGAYHLSDISMNFAEKLTTKEDITKEANEIIENSFLSEILQIILTNEGITRTKLIEKILINSSAGNVKDRSPYNTTIYCILDILNLSGKITKEKFTELRGSQEQTTRSKTPHTGSRSFTKKEKSKKEIIETSLQAGIHGIVKTINVEVKIRNIEDLKFARLVLDKLEKELSNSNDVEKTTSSDQTMSQS